MNLGEHPKQAVITLCGFFLFFLGFSLLYQKIALENIGTLFAVVLLTVALSYGNRTPLGGLVLGLFTSLSFLLGLFLMICIWQLTVATDPYKAGWGLSFLAQVLSAYGQGMLSAVTAFGAVGAFFGLLGYVSGHTSLQVSVSQPMLFRDYWSSIHSLGKSRRGEYGSFDRRLSSWSFRKRDWWKRLVQRLIEPQPDLVFVRQRRNPTKLSRGDLFDLTSGRMIGRDLADPLDLTSKHRPRILKVAEISPNPKGVRRIAFENLVARLLDRLIPSRIIWIIYLSLSAILTLSVYYVWTANAAAYPYYEGADYDVTLSAAAASAATLFLVWRWRKSSKELFEKRPDERVLIITVYAILALLYGFYFEVIVNPPGDVGNWAGPWLVWTRWYVILALLLGFGYVCMHRECEVVNTYFYDNSSPKSEISDALPFRDPSEEPFWLREDGVKAYWVLRFMYYWRYELAKIPHSDWERVEVWTDAETGKAKWVVSDYHYRELWYRVRGELPMLYVKFFMNFHTPIPVVDQAEVESLSDILNQNTMRLIKMATTGKSTDIAEHLDFDVPSNLWPDIHPSNWISNYGLSSVAAEFCSKLSWDYWRYPNGLENAETYLERSGATPEEQPTFAAKKPN